MYRIIFLIAFIYSICIPAVVHSQAEHWYLLKSLEVIQEEQSKAAIVAISEISPEIKCWFNGSKSSTFGCKSQEEISWSEIIPLLNEAGFFIADVSNGELHLEDDEAVTSIFYQRAYYYFVNPQYQPAGFIAKLNEDEWEALPEEVQTAYINNSNYYILED